MSTTHETTRNRPGHKKRHWRIQFAVEADEEQKTVDIFASELGRSRALGGAYYTPENVAWALRRVALRCLQRAFEIESRKEFLFPYWTVPAMEAQIEKLRAEAWESYADE